MTNFKPILTADGSHTLHSTIHNANYHSLNGAVQESQHIFISNGFNYAIKKELNILEVGFGTGLNAALTAYQALIDKRKTMYQGIDLYPLSSETLSQLNYFSYLQKDVGIIWKEINSAEWNKSVLINDYFILNKINCNFITMDLESAFDIIYFDAFAPEDQIEMWSLEVFQKLYFATSENGILVTYCSKGIVKEALRRVGYEVTRLSGPPGKRHIIRAKKC
ncbi:MAG: tRNA (5-methylaminomethyl-2-thiouridine)(34)-methyltransferase MnmD [Tenuifilaceae bacterium]